MFADAVIEQAHNDIKSHSTEMTAPKFWNISHGGVCLGMRRRSTRQVFEDLDTILGVYSPVSSAILEPAPTTTRRERPGRTCRELSDFVHDGDASLSLWTVPLNHVSVPESERDGKIPDEDDEQQEASDSNHAPHDHGSISNSSFADKAMRIALDFRTPKGQFKRRTGTIRLRRLNTRDPRYSGGPGLMGWSVRWDSPRWFPGVQVGLSIPMPLVRVSSGHGSTSHPIEIEDQDQDEESRFAFLVWMGKMPNSKAIGNTSAEASVVSMIFKKQDGMQLVQFTEEEKRAFGVGLSKDQAMANYKLVCRLFQEKSNVS